MALSIHTNYASLVTQNTLNKNNSLLSTAMQRLGTGLRINSAADDAAGLQIATRLSAQSRGMSVAQRNAQDAISLLQTAEGAFNEMTDVVQRMKDLATQAANGTNSVDDLKALQAEYDQLGAELYNIMENTRYAGEKLFGGDGASGTFKGAVNFQIGSSSSETMEVNVSTLLGATATGLVGTATTDLTNIAGTGLKGISAVYTLNGVTTTAGKEIAGTFDANGVQTAAGNPNGMIDVLNDTLDLIGSVRAKFGATINRLEHTANNLANMQANTDMAKGRIMDADFAAESSTMTKQQMLMQSGISVLSNSNQMSGLVASLLR